MKPNWFIGFCFDDLNWYETVITNAPAGIKTFSRDDLHVTFAFLKQASQEEAMLAWRAATDLNLNVVPVAFRGIEAFGDKEHPSAYGYTFAKGNDELSGYLAAHRDQLRGLIGLPPDKYQTPRPHATIGRPEKELSSAERFTVLTELQKLEVPQEVLKISRLGLYTWSKNRSQKLFDIVESVKLVGGE